MKRWAEPNNMIAESKPTNNIDPNNTETANQWMYVLPAQAASRDQLWRKMRHWQIKWSCSEAYPAVVKWNKFPKHMRDRIWLWETVQPHCLNSERTIAFNAVILMNVVAVITHFSKFTFHILGVCTHILLHQLHSGLTSWTTRWFIDLNIASKQPAQFFHQLVIIAPWWVRHQKVGKVSLRCLFQYQIDRHIRFYVLPNHKRLQVVTGSMIAWSAYWP